MAGCVITGTIYQTDGVTPNGRVEVKIRKVFLDGALISTADKTYYSDRETGVVTFTLPRGSVAYIKADVEGFDKKDGGTPVTIPDAATANLEDLMPALSPPSTAVSQAAFQSEVARATAAEDALDGRVTTLEAGASGGAWGEIGGSLPDQADLTAALAAKADASALTAEASSRVAGDASTLSAANSYTDTQIGAEASARAGAISSASTQDRARSNHTGTQSADTLTDGTANKAFLAAERTKLAGIAAGATANSTDAQLRDRSTHTGTQTAATISDFNSAASSAAPVQSVAGKVGAVSLTPSDVSLGSVTDDAQAKADFSGYTAKTAPVDADTTIINDSAAAGVIKKLTWANIKATLKTYFDTVYQAALGYTPLNPASNLSDVSNTATARTNIGAGTGNGSVTSVGLSVPGVLFSVSGSPVTASGTFSFSLLTQTANTVFAGPTTGTAATPSFRALVAADVPSLDASKVASGTLDFARLPITLAQISGSDVTTTGQSLVDVTGLSAALSANSTYEFTAVLYVQTSADASGTRYGVNFSAAGSTLKAVSLSGSRTTTSGNTEALTTLNTSSGSYMTTSGQSGAVLINGLITTGANAGNLTIQHLKISSGTSTVKIGSYLKVTKVS